VFKVHPLKPVLLSHRCQSLILNRCRRL